MQTLADYDELPYSDCPITVSRPDNLYNIGKLFNLHPPHPQDCRVLELGCAGGGNLIPLAYYWPQSQFVGVELSRKQAESANTIIDELQLDNVRVLHRDLLSLDENFDRSLDENSRGFDYIIAHGVYSWVPPEVQQHLLQLCNTLLRPNGIAYISYNTLPGWDPRNMLRDMMLYHAKSATSPREQLDKSMEMLTLLSRGLPEDGSLSERWLKQQADELLRKPPNYVFHDYLEKHNTPVYFHQFARAVEQHNLKFFAEASLYTMLSSTLTPEGENALDQFDDPIEYEQYMDFFYIKHFRQSLLCHAQCQPRREINVDILKQGYFYANLFCSEEIDLFSEDPQTFTSPAGDGFLVSHPLAKAALTELLLVYPDTCRFDDLTQRAANTVAEHGDHGFAADVDTLFGELMNLYLSGAVDVSSIQGHWTTEIGEKPAFNTLTRVCGKHGKISVASVHHDSLPLNSLQRKLIELADGERTLSQITRDLDRALRSDADLQADYVQMRVQMRESFAPHTPSTKADKIDSTFVQQMIQFLAYQGLLDQ